MALSEKALATRQRILTAATELFYLQGYNATGLDKVITTAGITKGNFYYHFKSKEELAVATLDWQFELVSKEFKEQVLMHSNKAIDKLFKLLKFMSNRQKKQFAEGFVCGCYFGNFTLELSTMSQSIRDKVKFIFNQYLSLIKSIIQEAINEGDIDPQEDAEQLSHIILGQVEGAILLDKANQQPDNFDKSIHFIKRYLGHT
ncbi:TetR/AcrR family transcriptional regulator [sulfur-oxidizing endosymbiont of Gigantopelta aegis]|uniref:TetR/AcrR family transcriptional regulator n=1 Tax=sulfur-oxidizing endosymbiont of Gigantopelta aegis TaxID=2794934 RepID=UPI0018DB0991|nr:TetR/AcrR family transcriptional regulator [sulfur-oxidizing endosymbiont of Gigantopelta aegis]